MSTREALINETADKWDVLSRVKKRREDKYLSSIVKARLVGGCLVITLPQEIRKEAGIEPGEDIHLELDKDNREIRLSKKGISIPNTGAQK